MLWKTGVLMKDLIRTMVTIDGRHYAMKGNDPEEHIHRVALHVDRRMREVRKGNPNLDTMMTAVLAAITITDEYIKSKESAQKEKQAIWDEYLAEKQDADKKHKEENAKSKKKHGEDIKKAKEAAGKDSEKFEIENNKLREQSGELALQVETLEKELDEARKKLNYNQRNSQNQRKR